MLALAVVESGRLLRHPAVLAAAAFGAVLLWSSGRHIVPVLSRSDIATQIPVAPLAAAALLATNLARCELTATAPTTCTALPA